ncbi:hypothetical protein ACHWQZ_G009284 [Mnemiopsis leidyi]
MTGKFLILLVVLLNLAPEPCQGQIGVADWWAKVLKNVASSESQEDGLVDDGEFAKFVRREAAEMEQK